MIFQSANFNCVISAISIVRLALGYKEPFENGIPLQSPTEMLYILKYKDKFFPEHVVEFFLEKKLLYEYINRGHIKITDDVLPFENFFRESQIDTSNFITIFDYVDLGYSIPMSHTVIGHPTYFRGMTGQYILKVNINYQLELGI